MDILNLSQNAGHASGLPMQAETIAGLSHLPGRRSQDSTMR